MPRENRSDVTWLQDQYDAAAHAIPDNEGWLPDPMHEYDPRDAWMGDEFGGN